jgi:hypothetical protein
MNAKGRRRANRLGARAAFLNYNKFNKNIQSLIARAEREGNGPLLAMLQDISIPKEKSHV